MPNGTLYLKYLLDLANLSNSKLHHLNLIQLLKSREGKSLAITAPFFFSALGTVSSTKLIRYLVTPQLFGLYPASHIQNNGSQLGLIFLLLPPTPGDI